LEKGKPHFRCVVNVEDWAKKNGFDKWLILFFDFWDLENTNLLKISLKINFLT
jgi:hypothetical protein